MATDPRDPSALREQVAENQQTIDRLNRDLAKKSNDVRIIHRVANEVDAGMKWVNQFHYGYDELPFGGVKQSGYGKEHGAEGLDYYLEDTAVVVGGLE